MSQRDQPYTGFEQGPIRPPSEARSLLIRVTRNCPWNRCSFCPVYKGTRFSARPVEHVIRDIDAVHQHVETLQRLADEHGRVRRTEIARTVDGAVPGDSAAFAAAFHWFSCGQNSIFLQDANSLVTRPADLARILTHLKDCFPQVTRITSYARSHTLARMAEDDLKALGEAGLNRLHVGLESGSDRVLEMVDKGATKEMHVEAGRKVKSAGIELSEYTMPGLGGTALSAEHARETADALNRIDPDFIRLRTLAISERAPLAEDRQAGRFTPCSDLEVVRELLTFVEALDGISSVVQSDHILNLLGDLEGTLPQDKERMRSTLRAFLDLEPELQILYQIGRRLGVFAGLQDMDDPQRLNAAESARRQLGVTAKNVDEVVGLLMTRFL